MLVDGEVLLKIDSKIENTRQKELDKLSQSLFLKCCKKVTPNNDYDIVFRHDMVYIIEDKYGQYPVTKKEEYERLKTVRESMGHKNVIYYEKHRIFIYVFKKIKIDI